MRIHQHVSILLLVAVVGAAGLATTVGFMLGRVEDSARLAGRTAEQREQISAVVTDARYVQPAVESVTLGTSEKTFQAITRALEGSASDLKRFRESPVVNGELVAQALDALREAVRGGEELAKGRADGTISAPQVAQFRDDVTRYLERLGRLERAATRSAADGERALARWHRSLMVLVGVFCLLYLGIIERLRRWTSRRLIHPVQRLAEAAMRAVEDKEALSGLEAGSPEELNTLAQVLNSFVDRLRERTAEVERQKEHLEREIVVRRRAEDQLRNAAFVALHDKLTGLCNRDLLLDRLERCMERARRLTDYKFAVLFLDIDRFKEVNDRLGHFIGDQLLVAIAERLQKCLRSTDSFSRVASNTVARVGGDEFVVLLDGIRAGEDASQVAERVQAALSQPFDLYGHEIRTTASIGIAFNELESETADYLLRDADTAMYYAKAAGKARHEVFNKKMHEEAVSRLQLHDDLQRAVENEEFELRYQPIVSLGTGRLVGFEVLARWDRAGEGAVNPVEFIGHAEETGVIIPLGRWVLEESCRQLARWREKVGGGDVALSVNVSRRQLVQTGFTDEVKKVLRETGVRGADVKLEITETVIMENPDSITDVLRQLKGQGMEIHMDDFGTGYSSLSYLHLLPIDVLKIDRAFLSTMSADHDYADVIQTVVALAHTLDMKVTVEGVETWDQLARLLTLRCDYAQGFYFSQPLTADEAEEILRAQPEWLKSAA